MYCQYIEHNDKQDTVNYRVDRHTPRNPRQLRRAYSPHDENEIIEGKKMKLEPQISGSGSTRPLSEVTNSSTVVPRPGAVYKHSAVWPSVIFSQQNKVENKLPTKVDTVHIVIILYTYSYRKQLIKMFH